MQVIIPKDYQPTLSVLETQEAIKYIRDTFQAEFGKKLRLSRISAPLFVTKSSGLNDNLNGIERPVSFDMQEMPDDIYCSLWNILIFFIIMSPWSMGWQDISKYI